MHQTTVRFGADLWEALDDECARLGLSVAQYLREAALARLVYAAGKRGDDDFELALALATAERPALSDARDELNARKEPDRIAAPAVLADIAYERAARDGSETSALAAQGRLARERARGLRGRSDRKR